MVDISELKIKNVVKLNYDVHWECFKLHFTKMTQ